MKIQFPDNALDSLSDRERAIINMIYVEEKSLGEVADAYGVTRERIRQIEANALRKISKVVMSIEP